jgi:hypothetical protein
MEKRTMGLEMLIHEVGTHLSFEAAGQYSLASLYDLFYRVKEESEKHGCQDVMLDVTAVSGTIPVMDLHVLGEHGSKVWKLPFRIAIISPDWALNKFFENVARNRGAQVAIVPNQAAAIEWLARNGPNV